MKLRPKPMAYIFVFAVIIWLMIFTIGFFKVVITLIIVSALAGLFLRLTGRM